MQPSQREIEARSRELVEQALRNAVATGNPGSPAALLKDVALQAQEKRAPFDWHAGLTYWWDLCRMGAIALVGGGDPTVYGGRPLFVVTPLGRRLLERKDASPHNADRFLDNIRSRVPVPDPIAMAYVEEAAGAWRAGLDRASVVMLGAACERLVLLLAEAVRDGAIHPYSQKIERMLTREPPVGISELFEQVRAAAKDARLPGDLGEAIDRKLAAIFDHARALRNAQGHPTGESVTSEEAEAGLLMFAGFYERIDRIIAHLKERVAKGGA